MNRLDIDEKFWGRLMVFIQRGNVVPVVGQDLLTLRDDERETTLYELLARRLAQSLGVDPAPSAADGPPSLNRVVAAYLEDGGKLNDVYPELMEVAGDLDTLPIPEPLLQLTTIPFDLFVSTTFDPLLKRAVDHQRFGGSDRTSVFFYSTLSGGDLPKLFVGPAVFHLLGRLSAMPEYAVTDEDVLEFVHQLQSDASRPQRLLAELGCRHLLILGSGFPNWLARFFIRIGRSERHAREGDKTDLLADRRIRADPGLVFFLEHFSEGTRLFQGGGARKFVERLAERWQPLAGAKPPKVKPATVFLSYASEDAEAAARVRNALAGAGLKVWFDKAVLESGDRYWLVIQRAIEACSLFVPLISRNVLTLERRSFRIEWEAAEDEAKKASKLDRFIIPLAIDGTSFSDGDLAERFGSLHWERYPDGRVDEEFVARIQQRVG